MLSGHIKAQPVHPNKYSQKYQFENFSLQLVEYTWSKGSLFLFSLSTDTPLAVYILAGKTTSVAKLLLNLLQVVYIALSFFPPTLHCN
jgi:hypothetical protein